MKTGWKFENPSKLHLPPYLSPYYPNVPDDAYEYAHIALSYFNKRYPSGECRGFTADVDYESLAETLKRGIEGNIEMKGDPHNITYNNFYLLTWLDTSRHIERGLTLFYVEIGSNCYFNRRDYSNTIFETLQIRFDDTRWSAGVSRMSAWYLKYLVDEMRVADRVCAGGSTEDSTAVKNAYEKFGYTASYQLCYER